MRLISQQSSYLSLVLVALHPPIVMIAHSSSFQLLRCLHHPLQFVLRVNWLSLMSRLTFSYLQYLPAFQQVQTQGKQLVMFTFHSFVLSSEYHHLWAGTTGWKQLTFKGFNLVMPLTPCSSPLTWELMLYTRRLPFLTVSIGSPSE